MQVDATTYRITGLDKWIRTLVAVGVFALVIALVGLFINHKHFFHSYLHAVVFWTSLGLGGLFFTLLHNLVGAKWSVVLRRMSEHLMGMLPTMAVFFLPILIFGIHDLYHWSHEEAVSYDHLLQHKAPYLNTVFFVIRTLGFFAIWMLLARLLFKLSLKQDAGDVLGFKKSAVKISAPGMIVFALTITFAAFDWLMSLDPHWYSTIFGVYFFAGAVLAVLSFLSVVCILLRKHGVLKEQVTEEHYHDLGKLLFGFTVFWAYIAFSQYFLIWYANIPEEVIWFLHRWEGSWKTYSILIVFGHFVVPFLVLLGRAPKRNTKVLCSVAVLVLVMHWIHLYWLVFPTLYKEGASIQWLDIFTTLGVGGIFMGLYFKRFAAHPIVPVNDPHLEASIHFENA